MPNSRELNMVEKEILKDLQKMGYEVRDATDDDLADERENLKEVVLQDRLKQAIKRINPWISNRNIGKAVNDLKKIKLTDPMQINKAVHKKLVQHTTVTQDLGEGRKKQTVKFIDYKNPENNDFLAVRQFKVAGKENIIPDIVVFVNGLPMGVIECKSPTIANPKHEAVNQLRRYQNVRKVERAEGAEELFYYNQFIVGAWKEGAVSAGYKAPEEVFKAWKDPYPADKSQVKEKFGKEKISNQDKLIYSLFKKDRFLEMIRFFTIFEDSGQGMAKIIARYQQYRAVKKAIKRIKNRGGAKKQGGVIWHTQGSGKSFTMLFLGLKLKQIKDNPTLLIVTDRTALDDQIKSTFEQSGFPNPKQAQSIDDLKTKLKEAAGQTITTLVHKFQEKDEEKEFPLLSKDRDIYVMTDEAHRTQYGFLAGNMRKALPNAFYIGFSGTPIEKEKKSTSRTFGQYIDKYTIDQSIEDGTTLPIFYQNRKSEVSLVGDDLDQITDRLMKDRTEEEKEEIRKRYVREQDLAEAEDVIEKKALDLINHFEEKVSDPFKAMVVTVSRRAAGIYGKKIKELNGPEAAVIVSRQHNDEVEIKNLIPETDETRAKKRFKDPNDPLKILIVCDKLLTGFDAPVAQVMYLDKPLKDHNLLQAIARVNRPYEDKNYGLVIDYYGVSTNIKEALNKFSSQDVQSAMIELTHDEKVISKLEAAHRKATSYFNGFELSNLEKCVEILGDEEKRLEFNQAFKQFSKYMDIVLPEQEAMAYRDDLKKLGEIYQMAKNRYRDEYMDLAGIGKKVREMVKDHVRSSEIEILNPEPISIMDSKEFSRELEKLESNKAKASEMEHAVKHEISVQMDKDPVYYKSLQEKVEKLINQYNQKRIEEEEVIEELEKVIEDIRSRDEKAKKKGFSSETGLSFYNQINSIIEGDLSDKEAVKLTKSLMEVIEDKVGVVDWKSKLSVQKEMRSQLKIKLYPLLEDEDTELNQEDIDVIAHKLVKLARHHF